MSTFTDRLASICFEEWERWGNGNGGETANPYYKYVKEYWVSIGIDNLDGRTVVGGIRPAWSAAFVSFCVRKAGAGNAFGYAQAHCHYADKAMKAVETSDNSYGYWARRTTAHVPKVGDILCAGREYAKQYDYDQARMVYSADSFYPSHGDLIVAVESGRVVTMGGNLGNSVQRKFRAVNSQGRLRNRVVNGAEIPWIAVLECRL